MPTVYVPGSGTDSPPSPSPPVTPKAAALEPIPTQVPHTPIKRLYTMSYRGTPDFEHSTWSLRVDGLVDTPLTPSLNDLRALPHVTETRTLECISNPIGGGLIGTVSWNGTALAPLLTRAGVKPTATYVHFEAMDGYTTSLRVEQITQGGVLLVYGAEGAPLPAAHGSPLRILIPGLYGQKQPKWISRIHFSDHEKLGYWEQEHRGWSNTAVVQTTAILRDPARTVLPFESPIRFAGVAFAGKRAITRVELRAAQGKQILTDWREAHLIHPDSPLIWTAWVYDWEPPAPGVYQIAVRATDETGYRQERFESGLFGKPFPEGTDAIHQITLKLG